MPILVRDGGQWRTVTDPQVRDGGAWKQVQSAHVRDAGSWKQVYTRTAPPGPTPPPSPTPQAFDTGDTFRVTGKQVYWNSGSQDNQSSTSPLFIQGTWNGDVNNRRFTLVFFNDAAIRSFLAGATISQIWFHTTREGGTHGAPTANIRIGTTSAGSPIPSWRGTGVTARGNASVARGAPIAVPLTNATGTAFQNGTARSIAVGWEDTGLGISEYGRYVQAGSYIRFVGTK